MPYLLDLNFARIKGPVFCSNFLYPTVQCKWGKHFGLVKLKFLSLTKNKLNTF